MTVDLTSVANGLLSLVYTALLASLPWLVPALLRRLRIADNADLTSRVMAGATAAAGAAYNFALTHEGGLAHVAVNNAAIAHGASYMADHFAGDLKELNITPDTVSAMVSARLGVLLASDPAVSAGQPATALPVPPSASQPPTPGTVTVYTGHSGGGPSPTPGQVAA
jgi:hypothetical protein